MDPTPAEVKDILVQIVTDLRGCKALELAARAVKDLLPHDIPALTRELVKERRLVEIGYVFPGHENVVSSFFLPQGTKLRKLTNAL